MMEIPAGDSMRRPSLRQEGSLSDHAEARKQCSFNSVWKFVKLAACMLCAAAEVIFGLPKVSDNFKYII